LFIDLEIGIREMKNPIPRSGYDLATWLKSLKCGTTPEGHPATLIEVAADATLKITYRGKSNRAQSRAFITAWHAGTPLSGVKKLPEVKAGQVVLSKGEIKFVPGLLVAVKDARVNAVTVYYCKRADNPMNS
jgi:hypothetical protein